MEERDRTYLSATGHDWTLPFYDPLVALLGADKAKRKLINQAALRPEHRILDIGCGTGTLALLIHRQAPGVHVTGLDPDLKALDWARRKARKAGVPIRFDRGFSDELPYPDRSFDRVFSSLMFHHVPPEKKAKTFAEVRRVLTPGGSLHLFDFVRDGMPRRGLIAGWIHRHLQDNFEVGILAGLLEVGFASAEVVATGKVFFGRMQMRFFRADVGGGFG